MLELRRMTQQEFDLYHPEDLNHLALELSRARDLSPEEGMALAVKSYDELFPGRRVEAPDQFVFNLLAPDGVVGQLHLGIRRDRALLYMYVWNVIISAAFRGRGYGEAALRLAENETVNRGLTKLRLNVMGHNSPAIALYQKLSYRVEAMTMAKDLGH